MIHVIHNDHKERCEILAEYLIKNKATVRETAYKYGISKSTVHKDITEKLKNINKNLYDDAKEILNVNKSERHIRGGEATKLKYMKKSDNENREMTKGRYRNINL